MCNVDNSDVLLSFERSSITIEKRIWISWQIQATSAARKTFQVFFTFTNASTRSLPFSPTHPPPSNIRRLLRGLTVVNSNNNNINRTGAGRRFVWPVRTVVLAVAVLVQPDAPAGRLAHEFGYATAQRQPDGPDQ